MTEDDLSVSSVLFVLNTLRLYRTVLFGNFYRGQLVTGQLCEVVGSTAHCSYFCGAMKPVLSEPRGQVRGMHHFFKLLK